MDLADFLLQRIADDEAAAKACAGPDWQNGLPATIHPDPTTYRTVLRRVGHVCGSIIAADAEHIARWDPARVLAECEAKRAIVEAHSPSDPFGPKGYVICTECGPGEDEEFRVEQYGLGYPCLTLRLLALPYAGHEAFREEWKP